MHDNYLFNMQAAGHQIINFFDQIFIKQNDYSMVFGPLYDELFCAM